MAHTTRGTKSHTFDIKKVVEVDLDKLTIVYTDAAHAAPQTMRLNVPHVTLAARQVVKAMADSISVYGDGSWESSETLKVATIWAQVLIRRLDDVGISDFSDPSVDLKTLRSVLEPFEASVKRTANKLIGRVLVEVHPNGAALSRALRNTTYMVKETQARLYDDVEADAIEKAAKAVFHDGFTAQRRLLGETGIDVSDREWLRVPATLILDEARERHGEMAGARQPSLMGPRIEQIDWALLNPSRFGVASGKSAVIGETMEAIGRALYPGADVLTSALILHCLSEMSGLNLSVMLRSEPTDLIYTGDSTGILTLAKARNHSEDVLAVRTESNQTLGGLLEALTGLTRFARSFRSEALAQHGETHEVVNRLYVLHQRDPRRSQVLGQQQMHKGWRSASFDQHWPDVGLERSEVGLRFTALRRKALERAVGANPKADVHGHSARTKVHYLANVLPEHTLVRHATAAQDDIVDSALARFTAVSDSSDERASELAQAIDAGPSIDVVVGVCTTGGNDPEEAIKPCSLGLAACFTCPSGYRTADHIPGLIAMVRYAQIIKDNYPDEWENGEAGLLSFFASECLKQFPPAVVRDLEQNADLRSEMVTINALYTELRR